MSPARSPVKLISDNKEFLTCSWSRLCIQGSLGTIQVILSCNTSHQDQDQGGGEGEGGGEDQGGTTWPTPRSRSRSTASIPVFPAPAQENVFLWSLLKRLIIWHKRPHPLYMFSPPITTYFSQLLSSLASPLMGTRVTPGLMVYLGGWVEGTLVVR